MKCSFIEIYALTNTLVSFFPMLLINDLLVTSGVHIYGIEERTEGNSVVYVRATCSKYKAGKSRAILLHLYEHFFALWSSVVVILQL